MGSSPEKYTAFAKPTNFHGLTSFSQGGFTIQNSGTTFADRQSRRPNLPPSLNSAAFGRNAQRNVGEITPGTGLDMNFTPLLPSQLLLGSPFQAGSPSFASPQFSSIPSFQQPQQLPTQPLIHLSSISQDVLQPLDSSGFNGHFQNDPQSPQGPVAHLFGSPSHSTLPLAQSSSRTVYLGNIPPETGTEEILGHVRSGQIESVRLVPDKNCAFISFLDGNSAMHFHSDAILKKLCIRGQDVKVGWGKPSQVPTSVALAVQQSGASRNVYLGNLPETITESELGEDLGKFGPIDTVKIVREKSIAFVHFLSISNAVKAVAQLPQDPKWQPPRRVYYGKDRCAYVSKTQQQNAAQYLGIAPGYAHVLNGADRDLISNALAQQSVAAAAVATATGGVTNLGNRTVYLGNIHPETTIEEICNVVRGGLLHHIRYIPDKHICFVTFIDPTSAASFYALSNLQGLMIHNRRLKIGWGKHSGALPPAIALAVSGGASRNVYIGNLDESLGEERLRQDFSDYGEIELVNALREKSCAFVNFTNIANAIKAIEAMRGREEYKNFKVNFGKDRCGNAPRPANLAQQSQPVLGSLRESFSHSPVSGSGQVPNGGASPSRSGFSPPPGSLSQNVQHTPAGPTPSAILNAGGNNPLTMYLNRASQHQHTGPEMRRNDSMALAELHQRHDFGVTTQQTASYGHENELTGVSMAESRQAPSNTIDNHNFTIYGTGNNLNGLLAPNVSRFQHSRALSMPVFSPEVPANGPIPRAGRLSKIHFQNHQHSSLHPPSHHGQQSSLSGIGTAFSGLAGNSFGVAISAGNGGGKALKAWAGERS